MSETKNKKNNKQNKSEDKCKQRRRTTKTNHLKDNTTHMPCTTTPLTLENSSPDKCSISRIRQLCVFQKKSRKKEYSMKQ